MIVAGRNASPRLSQRSSRVDPHRTILRVIYRIPAMIYADACASQSQRLTPEYRAAPVSIDQIVSDFDGVTFHVSTPESKSKILISIAVKCFRELVQYGAQSVLEREYGPFIAPTEAGYDFSIVVDLENIPAESEGKEDLIRRVSLLKRNAMAAPFERAFAEFSKLEEEAGRYTLEAIPQHLKDGGEVMTVHYREEEAIYIKASCDCVTVIFSTVFSDETDRIFGKVFLQVR